MLGIGNPHALPEGVQIGIAITEGKCMESENSRQSEVIPTQKQKHTYSHSYVDPIVKTSDLWA